MDFDFARIAVPFRMQPGLQRLPAGARHLTALDPASALAAGKRAVLAAGASRACVPGFDPRPALAAIARQAAAEGLPFEGPLELAFEEDFAVLDGATGTLPWLCVCAPSHWAPEDKLGMDFAAAHAPVGDGDRLRAAAASLVALATGGERWERHVWTVSPSGRHDQHPRRHAPPAWPADGDPQAFAAGCWLRVERQTFFPVGGGTRQAVFTIRVQLQPLAEAVDTPDKARRLHDSLASMSEAVLAYKGLTVARPRLLAWLAHRFGPQSAHALSPQHP
ncbi:heme-dependent oxidative N-demethylase subunit alpha family protein [Ramlibacter sp. MAHUQ-53]|uniref:heme-dependent oxidative N-demethylase subunit alpha family protein n=1 Tax=unclassified Ramlibacter TaxID=2617605 RepID=UPI003643C43F